MIVKNYDVNFKIENFEGPIDLLLHLIKQKKLDILEISLAQIADQYFDYIEKSKQVNLDVASEYLLMASQLLEIKSRSLLKSELFLENDTYQEETNNLLEKLIRYEKFKKASIDLYKLIENKNFFEKEDDELLSLEFTSKNNLINLLPEGTREIRLTLENIMKKISLASPVEQTIKLSRISVEDRKNDIEKILAKKPVVSFLELITRNERYFVAITLLVVLEIANAGRINIVQNEMFSDLLLERLN